MTYIYKILVGEGTQSTLLATGLVAGVTEEATKCTVEIDFSDTLKTPGAYVDLCKIPRMDPQTGTLVVMYSQKFNS